MMVTSSILLIQDQNINDALTRAKKGNDDGPWELYLATDDPANAPKPREDGRFSEGTCAPVASHDFSFKGKSIEDCVQWLRATPADVALNRQRFTALTAHSKDDDTVLICRKEEGSDLQYYPCANDLVVMQIKTAVGLKFDEYLQSYQRQRMQDGKPDRSKGEPYSG